MIERLRVNNYRCLENCVLNLEGCGSALVIGKNGSGKSTLRHALGVLQKICRGPNRVKGWIEENDFAQHRKHIPVRFEVDMTLSGRLVEYAIAFEMPEGFREARVAEERLLVDGSAIFSRQQSQVTLSTGTVFGLDWHVAALPVITERQFESVIQQFKSFCASMILIAPIPSRMSGFSELETFELEEHAENFADWFNALIRRKPESYSHLLNYLTGVIPDLLSFENVPRGENGNQLLVSFAKAGTESRFSIEFKKLSDGEKCFFLSAMIVASNRVAGPVFCLWDEPDNHLSLPEVGHFITHLRKLTNQHGQFIATSHHPEAIRGFSDENTIVLTRKSHLEPTIVRFLSEFNYGGDLIQALIRDEIIG
jgi:predicted ATPase